MKNTQRASLLVLFTSLVIGILVCLVLSSTAQEADESASPQTEVEQQRTAVSETVRRLGGQVQTIEETPVDNLFLVETTASDFIYVLGTGKHFFLGTLYEMRDDSQFPINLPEERRNKARWELIQALDKDETINYPPDETETTESNVVYVFTDVTCGYCRLLHQNMKDYNNVGIEIRYLAFPRAGVDTPAYDTLVSAWCADDPSAAMTLLKNGKQIEQKTCENPVAAHHQLGLKMRVSGTPALILADGSMVPGFQKAADLIQILEQLESNDSS